MERIFHKVKIIKVESSLKYLICGRMLVERTCQSMNANRVRSQAFMVSEVSPQSFHGSHYFILFQITLHKVCSPFVVKVDFVPIILYSKDFGNVARLMVEISSIHFCLVVSLIHFVQHDVELLNLRKSHFGLRCTYQSHFLPLSFHDLSESIVVAVEVNHIYNILSSWSPPYESRVQSKGFQVHDWWGVSTSCLDWVDGPPPWFVLAMR